MPTLAIRAADLGKQYRLGAKQVRYNSLRDSLASGTRNAFDRITRRRGRRAKGELMWALKDVNFQIRQGEVVGIIGRNGAGKSTLLKVLSRITDPSQGSVDLWGRVGSLLEVGTGFHPELTGRENIFLSGAILGMARHEMRRKFDEMVAFAEVEKFVDTAVKHYSSGMYLRLAFAVAAHLEPEILLVDEVLAVGDAKFQRKCLEKMQEVGAQGRTVLFVSHSMPAVTRLCPRALLLADGRIAGDGPAAEIAATYLSSGLGTSAVREWTDATRAPASSAVRLVAVRLRAEDGRLVESTDIRRPIGVELEYDVLQPGVMLCPHFTVHTSEGAFAFVGIDQDPEWRSRPRPCGRFVSTGWIPGNLLSEGMMLIGAAMRSLDPDVLHFYERDAVSIQVVDVPNADTARGDYPGGIPGAVRPLLRWNTRSAVAASHRPAVEAAAAGRWNQMLWRDVPRFRRWWMRGWMLMAGWPRVGRSAMRLASFASPPHRGRNLLARLNPAGFIAPSATIYHKRLGLGRHVFIDNQVVVYSSDGTGSISLGDRVHLYAGSQYETGLNGAIDIGPASSIQGRCQLMAYKGSIRIGARVAVASGCAFYPYDYDLHGPAFEPISSQPLTSRGDIVIDDHAWLGTAVIVLSGVHIGRGAVVAAGSVVTRDVRPFGIVAGVPARLVGTRGPLSEAAPASVAAASRHS